MCIYVTWQQHRLRLLAWALAELYIHTHISRKPLIKLVGGLKGKWSYYTAGTYWCMKPRNSLLAQLIPNNIVTLDLLLNGNTLLDYESNKNVILAVLHFIKSTRRFS